MSVSLPCTGTVGDLSIKQFEDRLRAGIGLRIGPFNAHLSATPARLGPALHLLYRDYPLLADGSVYSFHARLDNCRRMPLIGKPMVRFSVDGQAPHEDMPAGQALPVIEWGMNLVIALRSHSYLMLHSAVVGLDDRAMILPAAPGAGKTTLSAGLALRGWRLLSDEFGLIRPGSTELVPIPRPMALKNESIDVIRRFDPNGCIGPVTPHTRKGTVAHLRPPDGSIANAASNAKASWIVFPRWVPGAQCVLTEVPKAEACMLLASNAFNYEVHGEVGFNTIVGLVEQSRCLEFEYSDLNTAVEALTDFAERTDD